MNRLEKLLRYRLLLGVSIGAALFFMLLGVIFWGGFNTAMALTNNLPFCISCHEMEQYIYQDYKHSTHYSNSSGVRAICPDCHVPRDWPHMVVRKVYATQELFKKIAGTIDTPEKFDERQLFLATKVWDSMAATDSRECRNCHSYEAMNAATQSERSALMHRYGREQGKTCIDCHRGITHTLPAGIRPYRGGSDEDHAVFEQEQLACFRCHEDMPRPADDWD